MKIQLTIAAAFMLCASAAAQVNSPDAAGCLERAGIMMDIPVCQGVSNQLDMIDRLAPSPAQKEDADWMRLVTAYRSGQKNAACLAHRFLTAYPHSVLRQRALLIKGSIPFENGDYTLAYRLLRDVDAMTLDIDNADALAFRLAFCELKLGRYEDAEKAFGRLTASDRWGNAARFYQGYIAYATGDYARAGELFALVDRSANFGEMADFYLAQIHYMQGDCNKALALARSLAERDDVDPQFRTEALRVAGESLYNLGDEAQAITVLRRYVGSAGSVLPSTRYMLGVAEYRAGHYAAALNEFQHVADEQNRIGQSACLFIGQIYLHEGNNAAALLALEKARTMDYDKAVTETAYYNYAVARMKGGKIPFGSSVATFEEFLRRYPGSRYASQVEEYIVSGYMTDNDYDRALVSINAISRPSAKVLAAKQRVLFVLGTRSMASGNVSQALDHFNNSLKLSKYNAEIAREATLWQADCYYRLGQYAKAEKGYRAYLNSAPRQGENRSLATYDLAYALFAQKKYAAARTQFEKVTPESAGMKTDVRADAYNRIADTYYYTADFSRARENYDHAYEMNPLAGDYALYQKAIMRGLMRDHRGKIEELDRVIGMFPSSSLTASALLEKAQTYVAIGDAQSAIDNYRQVTGRFPATAQGRNALLQMAITYRNMGNESTAIATYREVVGKYPSSDEAQVAVDDLKSMYADNGNIEELDRFLSSVSGAPQLDVAEKSALASRALFRQASDAMEKGDEATALARASEIVSRYPDTEVAEDALAIKADVEYAQGSTDKALADYQALQMRASDASMLHRARMGVARSARDMGQYNTVIEATGRIMASSAAGQSEMYEVKYMSADAYARTGNTDKAVQIWSELAAEPANLYGAMSAYALAENYYKTGDTTRALKAVNAFIDADPPHQYWLARGFILLSDILRSQGNTFEADEYLRSLKSNYPGKEIDIFEMIDTRLKK